MWVDIDLHERSGYDDLNLGQDGISPESLADFWSKFAAVLNKDQVPGICGFGIANGPDHDRGYLGLWPDQAKTVIEAITAVDSKHFIFVGEDNWDPNISWNPEEASQMHEPRPRPTHIGTKDIQGRTNTISPRLIQIR